MIQDKPGCEYCRFYDGVSAREGGGFGAGRCRIAPPRYAPDPWPAVNHDDWCGEWTAGGPEYDRARGIVHGLAIVAERAAYRRRMHNQCAQMGLFNWQREAEARKRERQGRESFWARFARGL